MYIPGKFNQQDTDEMVSLMKANPFVSLITYSKETGMDAMHLPVIVEQTGDKVLIKGHIAKANGLWRVADSLSQVLVIFHGPHHYISPNYYPTKQLTGKGVPTWNYSVVHARGSITFVREPGWLLQLLDSLTNQHEANSSKPWAVTDAPEGYIEKMLGAIVGFEIPVEEMTGQWKLSQNQPAENRFGVIQGLTACPPGNAHDLAGMMKKTMQCNE